MAGFEKEKVLVCSAWPYLHSLPHLGNLIACLLSGDVLARFYRIKGKNVLYVSGSDAHGTRIEFEAEKKDKSPKELAEENHKAIKKLIKAYNIKFDNYTTTESEVHKRFVKGFFKNLENRGFLKTKTKEHAYCKNCERFLADRFIEGECPNCGYKGAKGNQCENCQKLLEPKDLIEPECTICREKKIEFRESKHWYLDLEKLEPKIREYVESRDFEGKVKNLTKGWLEEGLEPRAVTRDLKWGIQAPFKGAENKVIYVWAEAVLGYLSATKELRELDEFWEEDKNIKHIYTIGKDNIPFHTVVLPGLLLAHKRKWHLPNQIASTEYLNWVEGKAFSKSRNIGLFADEALELLDQDYWRFYLLYYRPEKKDVDFSWKALEDSINNVLIANFANFIHRTLTFTKENFGGEVEKKLGEGGKEILKEIKETGEETSRLIKKGKIRKALRKVIELSSKGNKYFQKKRPWEEKEEKVLYACCQLTKALGIYIYPFIPSAGRRILKQLGLEEKKLKWKETKKLEEKFRVKEVEPLFEKVEKENLKEKYKKLKGREKEMEKISFDQFKKLDLRVGKIKKVEDIEGSDKLYKLKVDTGTEIKSSVAGLKRYYDKTELEGEQVAIITNLEEAEIMGVTSEVMVLAAVEDGEPVLLKPDREVKVGSKIK